MQIAYANLKVYTIYYIQPINSLHIKHFLGLKSLRWV